MQISSAPFIQNFFQLSSDNLSRTNQLRNLVAILARKPPHPSLAQRTIETSVSKKKEEFLKTASFPGGELAHPRPSGTHIACLCRIPYGTSMLLTDKKPGPRPIKTLAEAGAWANSIIHNALEAGHLGRISPIPCVMQYHCRSYGDPAACSPIQRGRRTGAGYGSRRVWSFPFQTLSFRL